MGTDRNMDQSMEEILHPYSKSLFCYWDGLRQQSSLPLRSQLKLNDIRPLVANLFILERHPLKQSYKWRLAGSNVVAPWQCELTGQKFGQDWPAFEQATLMRLFDAAMTEFQPGLARFELVSQLRDTMNAEMLVLPVKTDYSNMVQIFGIIGYFQSPSWLGRTNISSIRLTHARQIWTEPEAAEAQTAPPVRLNDKQRTRTRLQVISGGRRD